LLSDFKFTQIAKQALAGGKYRFGVLGGRRYARRQGRGKCWPDVAAGAKSGMFKYFKTKHLTLFYSAC